MTKISNLRATIREKAKDKKGSLLWELMLVLAILFMFMYCCVSFLGVFVQFETMSHAAKTVARQIEVTGEYNEGSVQGMLDSLLSNNFTDTGHEFSGNVQDGKIQLRDTFTITINTKCEYTLVGFQNGDMWGFETFEIPMSYTVTGMSEVYHRDLEGES